ncbi:MAG: hypothetical protein KDK26_05810 [Roseivivax sp.]|nr:hypothetical protein [Roseivivax sp.]
MAELEPGARVLAGEVLGYLCSGPVRRVVVAPHDGIVPAEWPETGALLGYGDTVCRLETEQ